MEAALIYLLAAKLSPCPPKLPHLPSSCVICQQIFGGNKEWGGANTLETEGLDADHPSATVNP